MDEPATDCDECFAPIAYGVTCYSVPTGALDEGCPVVRIICATCYHAPKGKVAR